MKGCARSSSGAAANLPLTHRGLSSSVTFLAGHEAGEPGESAVDWKRLPKNGTLAIHMGAGRIEALFRGLLNDLPRVAAESKVRSPAGLEIGGAGPKVRTVTACPGCRTCPRGVIDSPSLAAAIDRELYGKAAAAIASVLEFCREHGKPRERFAATVRRVGFPWA